MKLLKLIILIIIFISSLVADRVQVEQFVERFYNTVLERSSDSEGLNYWTEELISSRRAGADIARGFIFSSEFITRDINNNEFVNILYRAFFNREADSEGFETWIGQLNSGISRYDILNGFLYSLEFDNLCREYGILAVLDNTTEIVKETLRDTFVYRKDSPYTTVLRKCIGVQKIVNSCLLSELPLLAQESSPPTKDMIMKRLVVSHQWMGERFSQMLDILPDDIKILLGSVTAIVIDDDIRPSYYYPLTGAIYLDPRYFWITPDEADTITKQDDYRSEYGNKLQFLDLTYYIKNGQYAIDYYSLDDNIVRDPHKIKYNLARLLYHELTHANDLVRQDMIPSFFYPERTIYNAIYDEYFTWWSGFLTYYYPLYSTELTQLGQVLYKGVEATELEQSYLPNEVGEMFAQDGASDMYAYSDSKEDLAMLFEATMMKYHYGMDVYIGFLTNPTTTNPTADDYILGWGEINSIASDRVKHRAKLISSYLLPNVNWDYFFDNDVGTSRLMTTDIPWYQSVNLANSSTTRNVNHPTKEEHLRQLKYYKEMKIY